MSETYSQNRYFPAKLGNGIYDNAGIFRTPRARRYNDSGWGQLLDLVQSYGVIAVYFQLLPHFSEILDEIEGKRIIIIDNQNHQSPVPIYDFRLTIYD